MRHIQIYSRIIQAYSEPCITLAYLELWYIQKLRIPGISKTQNYIQNENQKYIQNPGYSDPWDIQNRRHTQNLTKHLRWSALKTS